MASFDGLDRMKALLDVLENPEENFRVIHIAGTNGKGSTSVMTASILEEAGFTVGLYTSPHLESECERVQIWDGTHRMIDQAHFDELKDRVDAAWLLAKEALEKAGKAPGSLTVFERYTAAAYLFFREMRPDYVVLETGLGGRLDSTNTIEKPLVSVITQVDLDHTEQLGRTIYRIAHEKAGIIKPGVPVVSQSSDLNVKNILKKTAEERGCRFIDVSSVIDEYRDAELSMKGGHQIKNAATAAEAVKAAGIEVSEEAISIGLANAYLPGRFEILSEEHAREGEPYFIVDGAHNPNAIEALADTFTSFARRHKIKRILVIFGCMKDKNYTRMIQLLVGNMRGCTYAAASVEYGRAEDPERIGELFAECGRSCIVCESAAEAYEISKGGNYECVLVTGSIYLAGELRSFYLQDHKSL